MQTYVEGNMQLTNESMLSALEIKPQAPKLNLNELLFPAFNTLVPSIYENLLPHLSKVKVSSADIDVVITTFHTMVSFAFKTQLFDRMLWKRIVNQESMTEDEGEQSDSQSVILPQKLKHNAKTGLLKERLK